MPRATPPRNQAKPLSGVLWGAALPYPRRSAPPSSSHLAGADPSRMRYPAPMSYDWLTQLAYSPPAPWTRVL